MSYILSVKRFELYGFSAIQNKYYYYYYYYYYRMILFQKCTYNNIDSEK